MWTTKKSKNSKNLVSIVYKSIDNKKIDEEIKSLILERIKSIENPKASAFYQLHPDYPKNKKEIDRNDIIRVFIFKRR